MYCPECGFQNVGKTNYCSKCGALLTPKDALSDTIRYQLSPEEEPGSSADQSTDDSGTVLVIRSGGGRVGESFPLQNETTTVGRLPESDVFLDDITVSRRHAVISLTPEGYRLEDQGSLNGTYINRDRIESVILHDGDEVQIGKYKLTFLVRGASLG